MQVVVGSRQARVSCTLSVMMVIMMMMAWQMGAGGGGPHLTEAQMQQHMAQAQQQLANMTVGRAWSGCLLPGTGWGFSLDGDSALTD